MADGSVSENDLQNGLFYFMWPREDVLHPWGDEINELEWFFNDASEANKAHEVLRKNVLRAEEDGRAVFYSSTCWHSSPIHVGSSLDPYEQLKALLLANNYPAIRTLGLGDYKPSTVEGLIKEADIQLETIY